MIDFSFLIDATFWRHASIPITAAIIGYVTNVIAIWMMFHPIRFVGVFPPFGGWQGVVPRKASKMAAISVQTITSNLLDSREIFSRLDPQDVARQLEGPLRDLIDELTDDIMREHYPDLWPSLPPAGRDWVLQRVRATAPDAIAGMVTDLQNNVDHVFDLHNMVVSRLVHDKRLLNRIFLETGDKEFRFIGRAGAYFGFPLGCIQMTVWVFYQPWWLLPLFGLLVGYITNWSALKMIFNPKNKHRFGPFILHGLFFKRQKDVAGAYAHFVGNEVLTPANILEQTLEGPAASRVHALLSHHIGRAIDESVGRAMPLMTWSVGETGYDQLKENAVQRLLEHTPNAETGRSRALQEFIDYVDHTMAIQQTLEQRMSQLEPPKFEGMLRPAFEEDEWILIAVGAALGLAVGAFQFLVIFGGG